MNELALVAKHHLAGGEISPYDVSFILNDVSMSYLKGQHPLDAINSGEGSPSIHGRRSKLYPTRIRPDLTLPTGSTDL